MSAWSTTAHLSPAARRLGIGAAALLAWSGVGGAVSVGLGANTWSDAWSSTATLAAPWPMIAVQGSAAVLALTGRRPWAIAGSAVLFLAAGLSAMSGFFDGQFAKAGLSPVHVGLQTALISTAAVVAVLAGLRLRELIRRG
ncbi:hypothetical protein [Geodermatophilus sp. URMC 64]